MQAVFFVVQKSLSDFIQFLFQHHDHLAHFVAICFAVDALVSVYVGFRDEWINKLGIILTEKIAAVKTMEAAKEVQDRYHPILWAKLDEIRAKHNTSQRTCCNIATKVSILFAIACVVVAYFDWYGYWNIVLILPLPLCWVWSRLIISGLALNMISRKVRNHANFIEDYEGPTADETRKRIQAIDSGAKVKVTTRVKD